MAQQRLRARGWPSHILILCHGNICRSPYAEVRLRGLLSALPAPPTVESAGFLPGGRSAHPVALEIGLRRGTDLSSHCSRTFDAAAIPADALVVVMTTAQRHAVLAHGGVDRRQVAILGDLDPQTIQSRSIPDPFGGSPEYFNEVFNRIDRCMDAMVNVWAVQR